ncbi:hypothetical protein BGW80DRAFT_1470427 [Lactifluus volemus]|nr:hypothetical protein BGW80DRAFT_1470427 [Lactifluus volemus]
MSSPPPSPSPLSPSLKLGNLGSALRAASRKQLAETTAPRPSNPPTPSVAPPQPSGSQDEAGTNSQDFSPPVFTGTPISQPSSTPELIPPPVDTAGGGGRPSQDPVYFPPKEKLPPRRALTANDELSVFDIHNTFHRRWFLSRDHLMANVISAQKAKDGKISWVEFTPPYHAHLVKAPASRPRPRRRRNTLHGKGIAHRGENADERPKKPLEADHNGPETSGKGGEAKGKGKAKPPATSNKPKAPAKAPTAPPTFKVDPPPTTPLEVAKRSAPKAGIAAAGPATFFEQLNVGAPPARHSNRLNTAAKRGTRARVMKSVIDKP